MKTTTIKAPLNSVYLSDFMQSLPNGILNKKNTGCGATTLAIENNENYIICVPTITLVQNKVSQYPNSRCNYNLLGIYGETTDKQITDYLNSNQVKKILVTYDSLIRLSKLININDYKVCVDEFQNLLTAYSYRNNAINTLLDTLSNHEHVTYLSATPIEFNYLPEQLNRLPYTIIEWQNTQTIKVERIKTNNPYQKVINIINAYKAGKAISINGIISNEAYFFINSVSAIAKIIEKAGLKQSEVKIICANNIENKRTLKGFNINKVEDANKMFTFITRASFEGCDFYSKSGISYIISNNTNKNTLLDIATDIMQIAGRIRTKENPFKYCIYHIFNNSANECTTTDFNNKMNERIDNAKATISLFSKATDIERKALIDKITFSINNNNEDELTRVFNDTLILDDLKIKSLYYQFNVVNEIYNNGISIRDAYLKAGFDVSSNQQYSKLVTDFINRINNNQSFRDNIIEYIELKKDADNLFTNMFRLEQIENNFPIINKAYHLLGADKLKALRFDKDKIINAVSDNLPTVKNAILYNLKQAFKAGSRYSKADIKDMMQGIYTKLNITKKAKATDIKDYFDIKLIKINNKDGYQIIRTI